VVTRWFDKRSYSTLSSVSTGMGDCLQVGKQFLYSQSWTSRSLATI